MAQSACASEGPRGTISGEAGRCEVGPRGWLQIAIFKVGTKQRHLRQMADIQGWDIPKSLPKPAGPAGNQSYGHPTAHQHLWGVWRRSRHPLVRHIRHPPSCHPPRRLPGWLGSPLCSPTCTAPPGLAAVLPGHCLPAAWPCPAATASTFCCSKQRLRVGLLVSQLAAVDLGVGWLPCSRKPRLCVRYGIVSAFSAWLTCLIGTFCSRWHLCLV